MFDSDSRVVEERSCWYGRTWGLAPTCVYIYIYIHLYIYSIYIYIYMYMYASVLVYAKQQVCCYDLFKHIAHLHPMAGCLGVLGGALSIYTRWCPHSYKLVYNPINYRYNPLINPSYWTYKPT